MKFKLTIIAIAIIVLLIIAFFDQNQEHTQEPAKKPSSEFNLK